MTMFSVAEKLIKIKIERLRKVQNSNMLIFNGSLRAVVRSEMRLEYKRIKVNEWRQPLQLYFKKFHCDEEGKEGTCVLSRFSHVSLFVTLWIGPCQTPLFMGFSRQEYWSGLPYPSPGDLPDPGIEPTSPTPPTMAGEFFTTSTTWGAKREGGSFKNIVRGWRWEEGWAIKF